MIFPHDYTNNITHSKKKCYTCLHLSTHIKFKERKRMNIIIHP